MEQNHATHVQTTEEGSGAPGAINAARIAPPARFLIVGVANTVLGLAVIYLAKWLGVADVPANLVGYAFGLCVSFALNKRWTFEYQGSAAPAFARFLLIAAVAYVLNLLTVVFAIHVIDINSYAAQAIGIVPYTAFTYLASRYFAFRKHR